MRLVEARRIAEQDERDREHSQQVQGLQQIIQSQISQLAEKDQTIARKEQTIAQNSLALREKDETITQKDENIAQNEEIIAELREQIHQLGEKERELTEKIEENDRLERQLGHVNQQLEDSGQVIAQFQGRIAELEQLRPATDTSSSSEVQRTSIKLKLTWREGEKAPCKMSGSYHAAVDGNTLYVVQLHQDFCYTISTSSWSRLPNSPTYNCPPIIINNLLTLVGGHVCDTRTVTNQLFSLTGEGSDRRWSEEFPPMPTKRYGAILLCIEAALIVGGGKNGSGVVLRTVEVMNTETLHWSAAADLPLPLSHAPASVRGYQIYILGESNMYTCSLQALILSCKSFPAYFRNRGARVWKEVAAPPVTHSTCVYIHGRLLAIGGKDSDRKPTSAVHMYNPTTDSWEVISHMGTPRRLCIAAVLPNNQLMVVGGYTSSLLETDSIEFASIES